MWDYWEQHWGHMRISGTMLKAFDKEYWINFEEHMGTLITT
jgi:hypothetical protein